MAITQADLAPFINTKASSYPYSQNGLYYWTNPTKRNPVPNATVSGASLSPSSSYKKLANNTQALYDLMPYMSQAVNQTAVPTALSQLAASQATSPGYAQLMTEMYNTYGPQLNAIGNEILGRNMQAEAKNQLATIQGPGTDLVNEAYKLSQIYDKPYYDSRQKASDALSNLIGSIDVTGGLSETERNEIQQGLNRTNIQRGTLNSPSQTDVIADAMRYGQAGTNRKVQQQGLLSQAIQNASSFLPTAKSGVDVFQVATGKSSTSNPGNSLFTGVNKDSNSGAYGLAGNLFNSGTALDTTQMNIDANKKDWLDQFNQFASGLGSIMGFAKGMLAA